MKERTLQAGYLLVALLLALLVIPALPTVAQGQACTTNTINLDSTVNGTLSTTDCRSPRRASGFAELWTFNGTAGASISIAMSSAFDPYIYLLDSNGQIVAQDDDSGPGLDSLIRVQLPRSGQYTIEATEFCCLRTGTYTLTLGQEVPLPPINLGNGPFWENNLGSNLGMPRYSTREEAIGFNFQYAGQTFTRVHINSNGYLSFSNGEPAVAPSVPIFLGQVGPRNPRIAPAWGWWEVQCCSLGGQFGPAGVWLRRDPGTSGQNDARLIVTWNNVAERWDGGRNRFQVQLEQDGTISFHYGDVRNLQGPLITGISPADGGGTAVDFSTVPQMPIPPTGGGIYENFPPRRIDLSGRSIYFNRRLMGNTVTYSVTPEKAPPPEEDPAFPLGVTPANAVVSDDSPSTSFVAVGGVEPYAWRTQNGRLSATEGETVTYTKATGATGQDVVFVTDSRGTIVQASVNVVSQRLSITPLAAQTDLGATVNFQVQGGLPPYNIVASSGQLSSNNTANFVYTAPQIQGEHTITVTDTLGAAVTATVVTDIDLNITPRADIVSLAAEGGPRTTQLTAVNGRAPYRWVTSHGQLSSTEGASISLTPPDFTIDVLVTVTDSTGSMISSRIEVVAGVRVTPEGVVLNRGGMVTLSASGGLPATDSTRTYTWSTSQGRLDSTQGSGVIYTAPNEVGEFTVNVRDDQQSEATVSIRTVNPNLALTPSFVNLARSGQQLFTVSGGDGPFTFTATSGTLSQTVAGAATSLSKRQRSSSPQTVYSAPDFTGEFVVRVEDNAGRTAFARITVAGPIMITPGHSNLEPEGTQQFVTTGGTAPITWTASQGNVSQDGLYTAPNIVGEYMVTATDASGDSASATLSVTDTAIRLTPIFQRVQPRATINFTVNGGTSRYSWQAARGTLSATEGANVTYTAPGDTGVDIVLVVDTQGNSNRAQVFVLGALSITPETATVATGGSATFRLNGGVPPLNFVASAGSIAGDMMGGGLFVAPSTAGQVIVRAIDGTGSEAAAVVDVILPETLSISPSIVTMSLGGAQGFSATGGTGRGFVWSAERGTLSPTTGPSVTYAGPSSEATDTVTVTDNQGNTATAQVTTTGRVTLTPATANLNAGDSIEMNARGGTGLFSWTATGGTFSSTAGATVTFTPPSISGTYTVTATDTAAASANANVTVTAVRFDISPASAQLGLGEEARFNAIGGTPPYSWSVGGGGVVDPTSTSTSQETVTYFAPSNSRVDMLTAIDARGNIATAEIIVGTALSLTPTSANVGFGGQVRFEAVGGVAPLNWRATQGTFDTNTGRAVNFTAPAQAGSFQVTVSDGANHSATADITVANFPVVTPQRVFGRAGSSHTFTALGGTPPYTWSANAGPLGTTSGPSTTWTAPAVGGEYTITLTDAQGLSVPATAFIDLPLRITPENAAVNTNTQVTLAASGGIPPFNWTASAGDFDSTTGGSVTYTSPNTFGTETVTVRDSADTSASATINVVAPLRITPEFASVARNGTQRFNAVGGRAPYSWSVEAGDLSSTEGQSVVYTAPSIGDQDFLVTLTDNTGQQVTATVAVDRRLRITPTSATVEPGGRRRFVAQGGVTLEGAEFIWTATNGTFVDPDTGAEVTPEGRIITFQAPNTVGTSEITVIDLQDTEARAQVTIARPVRVTPSSARGVAGGQTLVFQAVDGAPPYTWTASAGDLDTTEGSTVMYTAPNVRSDIQLTVVDNAGKSATANIEVTGRLRITPGSANVGPGASQTFNALNGVGPYIWAASAGQFTSTDRTGGIIDWQATNLTLGQEATITVVDAQEKEATARVFVAPALHITPTQSILPLGGRQEFVGTGGTPPYTLSITGQGNLSSVSAGAGERVTYSGPNVSGQNTVVLTDQAGQMAQALVTIRQRLRVTPGTVVVERGSTVRLTAVGGTGENIWVASAGDLSSTAGSTVNYTAPIISGTYTVEVVDTEETSASVTVLVNEGGIHVTPGMVTVDPGGVVQFTASGGTGTFRWTTDAGFLSTVRGNSVSYTAPSITGDLLVTAQDSAGNSGTAKVVVSGALRVTPGAATVNPGATVSLQATGGAGQINWSAPEGGGLNPVTGGSTTFTAPPTTGRFHVVATDGAANQAAAVVTVINNRINVTPATANLETGGTQQFTASGGSGAFTWVAESGGISVDTTGAGITYTAPGVTGEYDLLVFDSAGNGGMANITVGAPSNRLVITPSDVTLDQGQEAVFTVSGGTPPYTFSGAAVTMVSNSTVSFSATEAGSFVITAADSGGRSASATITVNEAPVNDQVPTILMAGFGTTAIDHTSGRGGAITVQAQVIDDGGPNGLTVEVFTDQTDPTRNVAFLSRFERLRHLGDNIFATRLELPPGIFSANTQLPIPGFRIVATDAGGNQGTWPALNVRNEAVATPPTIPDPPALPRTCAPYPVISMAGFRASPFLYGTSTGGSAEIAAQICGGIGPVRADVFIQVPGLFGGPSIQAPLLPLSDADGNGIFDSGLLPIGPGVLPLGEFDLNFGVQATDGTTKTTWPELNIVR
ncbi:MAG: hypothetical protein HYY96_04795 [Candidatus Tectomicrobia bacterium]|nr:hypothetical protein [Candidatus Tectomicrobia bacterium]